MRTERRSCSFLSEPLGVAWRCLVLSIPSPITCAFLLDASLSYWRIICKMIDNSVSAILALCNYLLDTLSLGSNARL